MVAQLKPWLLAGGAGTVGRFMHLAREAKAGRARLGWNLLLELPIALGMGFTAHGGAEAITRMDWLDMSGGPTIAAAIVAGHLGPRVLDKGLEWLLSWKRTAPDAGA